MRKILLYTIVGLLSIIQIASSQSPSSQDLGRNRYYGEKILSYVWNQRDGYFYIGTKANGQLDIYDPIANEIHYPEYNYTRPDWSLNENHTWTLCVDDSGIVYGGSCQSGPEFIFAFYPGPDSFHYEQLVGIADYFIWCSAAPPGSYVYFGTDGGERGKLIKYNKYTYEWYDVFDSLYRCNRRFKSVPGVSEEWRFKIVPALASSVDGYVNVQRGRGRNEDDVRVRFSSPPVLPGRFKPA